MTDQLIADLIDDRPAGEIVAEQVPFATYVDQYAEHGCEWVRGYVVKMAAVSLRHQWIIDYLRDVLRVYFALRPIGQIASEKFLMKLSDAHAGREPDVMVILNTNPVPLTPASTLLAGAADICIEVVSPTSLVRDYDEKFREYASGGVREYWIIDYRRQVADFHRLNAAGKYAPFTPDADGTYRTPLLPGLSLQVPTLWQETLPDVLAVVRQVQAMLTDTGA